MICASSQTRISGPSWESRQVFYGNQLKQNNKANMKDMELMKKEERVSWGEMQVIQQRVICS